MVARIRPQRESDFQAQVIQLARLLGWRVAWFRPVRVQRRNGTVYHETPVGADGKGWPDLILTRAGRLVAAELKSERGRLTAEQAAWISALRAAGVEVFLWRPSQWREIEEVLR